MKKISFYFAVTFLMVLVAPVTASTAVMRDKPIGTSQSVDTASRGSSPRYGAQPLRFGSLKEWKRVHRPAIYGFFESQVYGRVPNKHVGVKFRTLSVDRNALGGKAVRKEIAMDIEGVATPVLVLMYLPRNAVKPVPAFVGMNFKGNHQINADPAITVSPNAPQGDELGADPPRGAAASRWPIEMLMQAGYAVVTLYRGDIDPDFDDGFSNGIHPAFYRRGQSVPDDDEWGTIAAWSWGLSRVMDYLCTDKDIDRHHVAVVGHSRLGKAALWAGAADKRFAMVISNDSGCGGAALSIRKKGETVAAINKVFPHWFCNNYNKYSDNEEALEVDQQGLIALIAPRPVYVASAEQDLWADPEGEFLAAKYASPVYELYGLKGLDAERMPDVEKPVSDGYVGYHIRRGVHDITLYDWQQYVIFADRHFRGIKR